jgi:hypothetical protein
VSLQHSTKHIESPLLRRGKVKSYIDPLAGRQAAWVEELIRLQAETTDWAGLVSKPLLGSPSWKP